MPEKDGFHIRGFQSPAWPRAVWHFCAHAERDTLVRDTPKAREAHLKECRAAAAKAEAARRSAARAEATRRLVESNRLRKENRAHGR
jgi:hypothetical protein